MNQKGFAVIFVILGIILVAGIVAGAYYLEQANVKQASTPRPVVSNPTTLPSPTQSTSTQQPQGVVTSDETANWKTYTNTKYGYLLKYPNDLPAYNGLATSKKDELVGMDTTDSVIFGCSGFGVGVCLPTFSASKSSLNEAQLNDIFNLKVGDQTTKDMTYTLGGMWNQKTNYTRLADKVVNGINFLVLDNPSGYGGSNRIWFVKKNGVTLQFSCIYTNQNFLNTYQNIISSFQSTQ